MMDLCRSGAQGCNKKGCRSPCIPHFRRTLRKQGDRGEPHTAQGPSTQKMAREDIRQKHAATPRTNATHVICGNWRDLSSQKGGGSNSYLDLKRDPLCLGFHQLTSDGSGSMSVNDHPLGDSAGLIWLKLHAEVILTHSPYTENCAPEADGAACHFLDRLSYRRNQS